MNQRDEKLRELSRIGKILQKIRIVNGMKL